MTRLVKLNVNDNLESVRMTVNIPFCFVCLQLTFLLHFYWLASLFHSTVDDDENEIGETWCLWWCCRRLTYTCRSGPLQLGLPFSPALSLLVARLVQVQCRGLASTGARKKDMTKLAVSANCFKSSKVGGKMTSFSSWLECSAISDAHVSHFFVCCSNKLTVNWPHT